VLQEAYGVSTGVDARPALVFGGGIGHAGDVCGAVSGGAIAVGQMVGDHVAELESAKVRARQLALPFYRDFEREFGHVDCRSLIDLDISTDEGFQRFKQSNLKERLCSRLVSFAVQRLLPLREQV